LQNLTCFSILFIFVLKGFYPLGFSRSICSIIYIRRRRRRRRRRINVGFEKLSINLRFKTAGNMEEEEEEGTCDKVYKEKRKR
jgi:hypothetical protein